MVKKESHTWPEIDRIEDEIEIYDQYIENLQKKINKLKKLLKEGVEVTKGADGHWNDNLRWVNWVGKVERELPDE